MPRGGIAQINNANTTFVDNNNETADLVDAVAEQGATGPTGPQGPPGPVMQIRFVVKDVDLIDNYNADSWNAAIGVKVIANLVAGAN